MFGKRKRRILKPTKPQVIVPQTKGERVTAREEAYLDQLEQMIAKPGLTPYIRRNGPTRQPEESAAVEPLFDSGPQAADPQTTARPNMGAVQSAETARSSLATEDGRVRLGTDGVYEIAIDVPAADLDEEDARAPRPPRTSPFERPPIVDAEPPQPHPDRRPEPPRTEEIAESKNLFPAGTLVVWNGSHLGVYKKHLEEKGYDLLYVVEHEGQLQPKGICLFAYQPRRVGLLSEGIFQWMERTMRWERDALVYHFDDPEVAREVPVLNDRPSVGRADVAPAAAGKAAVGETLVRGRTFTVSVGKHQWHGVYWGRDTIGTIVAHDTNRTWTLMHLDLDRFGAGLKLCDVLPTDKIREIEAAVNGGEN